MRFVVASITSSKNWFDTFVAIIRDLVTTKMTNYVFCHPILLRDVHTQTLMHDSMPL